jgi:hypothetical protein
LRNNVTILTSVTPQPKLTAAPAGVMV